MRFFLIGLVITLMATRFLEFILTAVQRPGNEIAAVGLGTAVVVAAFTAYTYVLSKASTIGAQDGERTGGESSPRA